MLDRSAYMEVRSGFLPDRIIHLHPTRLCNLACLHCYSQSGPQQRAMLELDVLKHALPLLKAEGYNQMSLSGGEPLTYPPLLPLVEYARVNGFRVTLITNGLLPGKRIDDVASRLDAVAISFDGLEAIHNRIRGRADAFERACATVARLADGGGRVAAAISLSREAIPDLPDLAEHLLRLGASALQIRPVAPAGRARTMEGFTTFSEADKSRLYLVVLALREELEGKVSVHCDLAPARSLWQQRGAYAALLATCGQGENADRSEKLLADLVNPLVITEAGTVKPVAYDFNPRFDVAPIETISRDQLARYKKHDVLEFGMLIGGALARMNRRGGLVDWFDYCTRLSDEDTDLSDRASGGLGAKPRRSKFQTRSSRVAAS